MALSGCWRYAVSVVPRLLTSRGGLHCHVVARISGRPGVLVSTTPKWSLLRGLSSTPPITDVTYGQLKRDLAGRTAVVIDVREPWELREYGIIPGSINVPLAQVDDALKLNPADFKEKYGGDKPQTADKIVFSCLAGVRSKTALDTATLQGYKDVLHYPGGWKEWEKYEQLKPAS